MDKFLDYEIVQPKWDSLREAIRASIQGNYYYAKRRMQLKIYGKPSFSYFHIVIQPQTVVDDEVIIDHEWVWDENTITTVENLMRFVAKGTIFSYVKSFYPPQVYKPWESPIFEFVLNEDAQ